MVACSQGSFLSTKRIRENQKAQQHLNAEVAPETWEVQALNAEFSR